MKITFSVQCADEKNGKMTAAIVELVEEHSGESAKIAPAFAFCAVAWCALMNAQQAMKKLKMADDVRADANGKFDRAIDDLESILSEDEGGLVVTSHHVDMQRIQ